MDEAPLAAAGGLTRLRSAWQGLIALASVDIQARKEPAAAQRLHAEFVGETGDPAERIAERARTGKPDLIVLGSHGRGHLASLVMGSVATKVLATTKVPVLLVR